MRFLSLAWKNAVRYPVRSMLTAGGVAVGSAAAVILVGMAWGFERGVEQTYTVRGTDLVIARITSRNPIPSVFERDRVEKVAGWPGVAAVAASGWDIIPTEGGISLLVYGWEPGDFLWEHLAFQDGEKPAPGDKPKVFLGQMTARKLGKVPGDGLRLGGRDFSVGGIFQSGAMLENGAAILPLDAFQKLTSTEGQIRHLNIRLAPKTTREMVENLQQMVAHRIRGLRAVRAGDVAGNNPGVLVAKVTGTAIALIAFVIAALGVANSLLMGVFERSAEIGLLVAVGWRRSRVLALILWEALWLSLFGAVVGIGIGLVGGKGMESATFLREQITVDTPPALLAGVFGAAVMVGLLGALYPAIRAASTKPERALRSL